MTRRQLLALLAALPHAVRLEAQTRPTGKHRIFLGQGHGLLLAPDGTLQSWSLNHPTMAPLEAHDKLGLGHNQIGDPFVLRAVPVPNLTGVKAISAGDGYSLALLEDGTVRAWGSNDHGQVGDGTTTDRDRPIAVPGVRNVVAISAGDYFSVALLAATATMYWSCRSDTEQGVIAGNHSKRL